MPAFPYDLHLGYPDTKRLVPHALLSEITSQLLLNDAATQYSGTLVGPPVAREALAQFITRYADDEAHPDALLMSNGALEGINIVTRAVCQPGDVVVVEDPTFFFVLRLFRAAHLHIETVPMTPLGLDLDALEALAKQHGSRLSAVYTIPSFHNPTGVTTRVDHRQRLVQMAQQYDFYLIEDATYQWLHFDTPAPPLLSHYDDGSGHAITVGTFSKIIMPALRQGFIWSTPENIRRFTDFKDFTVSLLNANLLGEFIRREHIDDQVLHARQLYKGGRDAFCDALDQSLPASVQWSRPNGGFFVWATLPDGLHATSIRDAAQARGLNFMLGQASYANAVPDNTMRLCFTVLPDDDLRTAAQILGEVIRDA